MGYKEKKKGKEGAHSNTKRRKSKAVENLSSLESKQVLFVNQ